MATAGVWTRGGDDVVIHARLTELLSQAEVAHEGIVGLACNVTDDVAYVGFLQVVGKEVLAGLVKVLERDVEVIEPASPVPTVQPVGALDVALACRYERGRAARFELTVAGVDAVAGEQQWSDELLSRDRVTHGVYVDSSPLRGEAYSILVTAFRVDEA